MYGHLIVYPAMDSWRQSLIIISERVMFADVDETDESEESTSEEIGEMARLSEGMLPTPLSTFAYNHCKQALGRFLMFTFFF